MIPSAAIKAYLKRPLESHRWVKKLSTEEVDAELARLTPPAQLNPQLRLHQRACFLLGVAYPFFCFWLDLGLGKSLLALELLRYWFISGKINRALIFVPTDKLFLSWEKQIAQFNIGLPLVALTGSSQQKWQQLEACSEGLVLLSYPGAVAMVSDRSGEGKLVLNKGLIAKLSKWAGAIVLDESTKAGSHQSLTFKMLNQLSKKSVARYALAGRPFGRDPTMLWSQYSLIDAGETLGETLGLFRAAFFHEQKCHWDKRGYAKIYTFNSRLKPQLARMLQHKSITYTASECMDVPKVTRIRETLQMPEETRAYYRRAVEEAWEVRDDMEQVKNVFLRMRQLSSGFVGFKNETDKVEIEMLENPKLERLFDLVEELPEGAKIVVFHEYIFSGRKITEGLKKRGIDHIWLWSGTKDARAEQLRFETKPGVTVAVINTRVGAFGLDGLQRVCNYVAFYENPPSVIDREQAEGRLVRQGQDKPVFIIDLVIEQSVDERILDFHVEGRSFFDAVLKNPGLLK